MAAEPAPDREGMWTGAAVSPLVAAVRCACPRCGQGRLYHGFLTLADRCAVCGLPLARNDSGDGPAVFLIFILGFLAVPLVFWLAFGFDLPSWAPVAAGCLFVVVLGALLLRPAKAYVVALQFRHRRSEFETGG